MNDRHGHRDLSERMASTGVFARVHPGDADERLWLDCDLASLAEHRLGDTHDPRSLDPDRRADWAHRAVGEHGRVRSSTKSELEHCYWILDGTERVGTIALATSTLGSTRLYVSSFYVLPDRRSSGLGRRALTSLKRVLAEDGLGIRLDSFWTWQRAVRFYLNQGMWVYMWKHDLAFVWEPGIPEPKVRVDGDDATISASLEGADIVLARAHRNGGELEFDGRDGEIDDPRLGGASWYASSTLSVVLAMHGWPLIRSRDDYEREHFADGGPPESLAYKIQIWEAWDAKHGWPVETPRIPGLEYPTWDELEARWNAKRAELESSDIVST